jgi:WD40 repeat protein
MRFRRRYNTLKVWDLDIANAVVSAFWHHTLKVWNLDTGHMLRTMKGHSGTVWAVAVTADGERALSASEDRTVKVWNLRSGRMLNTLEGHLDGVLGVAVTPDAKQVVSASDDRTLKVWDLDTGRPLLTLEGDTGPVSGVALTPDGKCRGRPSPASCCGLPCASGSSSRGSEVSLIFQPWVVSSTLTANSDSNTWPADYESMLHWASAPNPRKPPPNRHRKATPSICTARRIPANV